MAHGVPREFDTVIVGNGPSALILSYILHGNLPYYDESRPHPDPILHEKLLRSNKDLLNLDIDGLTEHFAASRFSYSTQALPVNVLWDTLVRPQGETDDAQKTCIKWHHDPSRAVSHLVMGNTIRAGGQWVDNPAPASWDIGTLSYAGMISLPGYGFDEHYQRRYGQPMPIYLRPSRQAVAEYLATYPDQAGIAESLQNGQQVTGVSRYQDGFHIASHNIFCRNLVLASGIFSDLIPPPPVLTPLLGLAAVPAHPSGYFPEPLLVIGSGFSAADVIISSHPRQRIIHVYRWAPSTSPSPLRACHQQAYPEYAGVYRRMKLAALSSPSSKERRPKVRQTQSEFDLSRDWKTTYEGLPNAEIIHVESAHDRTALVTFRTGHGLPFQYRVGSFAYVVGRRGSLNYLSSELVKAILPSDAKDASTMVSGQTLREKANEDLELAPHVFIIGSLTGDSLIRFAYGGCAYAAGKIMRRSMERIGKVEFSGGTDKDPSGNNNGNINGNSNDIIVPLREGQNRCQTPSPRIPAMNGLDGHEASPVSLVESGMPLDRRQTEGGTLVSTEMVPA
ncbi:uncharacterized protein Z518_02507 [Rhinocladiella mackenziei CBS 650.93]|uniref:L-ornithine N(5)-oxygenase n=1 Tax=Rhinocladiella mackenziei CBS 650.93 TaxID=1442369 RepID=A0A0D2HBP0_9EURO|nr:uncharacterized protein Z518_02507 [Rhinocladiella mackenziei CBS 650.93]KIX07853.1 hypothetical protein Z518_02507 [Rhinocladiella mackenziei CBS 650.93]